MKIGSIYHLLFEKAIKWKATLMSYFWWGCRGNLILFTLWSKWFMGFRGWTYSSDRSCERTVLHKNAIHTLNLLCLVLNYLKLCWQITGFARTATLCHILVHAAVTSSVCSTMSHVLWCYQGVRYLPVSAFWFHRSSRLRNLGGACGRLLLIADRANAPRIRW